MIDRAPFFLWERSSVVGLLLLAVACSPTRGPELVESVVNPSPTRGDVAKPQNDGAEDADGPRGSRKATRLKRPPSGDNRTFRDRSGQELTPGLARSRVKDAVGDTEDSGQSPAYIDIVRASIEDRGTTVRLRMLFAGSVPERMSGDDTHVIIEFRLERRGDETSISASADDQGWSPARNGRRYPGTFDVQDRSIVFVVPWRALGGRGALRWTANSSWTRSVLLSTDYGFDAAPNERSKHFRG